VEPPFWVLWKNGYLEQFLFSWYLQEDNAKDGELLLGGIDHAHYTGSISYTPIIEDDWYVVGFRSIAFKGVHYNTAKRAIVDSGTSYLVGPTADVARIAEAMGTIPDGNGNYYFENCPPTVSDMTINLGNTSDSLALWVTSQSFVLNYGGICYLAMSGDDFFDINGVDMLWILGDVFMREWYSIFDVGNGQMGFARAIQPTPTTSGHPTASMSTTYHPTTAKPTKSPTVRTSVIDVNNTQAHYSSKTGYLTSACGVFWFVCMSAVLMLLM